MMLRIVCIPPPPTIGVLPAAGTHQPFAREAIESAPHGAVFCFGDRIDEVNPGRNLDRVERPRLLPKQRQDFVFDPAPRSHVPDQRDAPPGKRGKFSERLGIQCVRNSRCAARGSLFWVGILGAN